MYIQIKLLITRVVLIDIIVFLNFQELIYEHKLLFNTVFRNYEGCVSLINK